MTRRYPSRPARMLAWTLAGALTLIAASAGGTWLYLRASLPQLDGRMEAVGIGHPVSIARDAIGNVTIRADDRLDAAFATGFAHAQDRFFQMDLVRRSAAGELAALVSWVNDFLIPVYAGPVTRWCPAWWEHHEAVGRLHAVRLAYLELTDTHLSGPSGPGLWHRDHLDPALDRLLGSDGPFADCLGPTGHRPRGS